MSKFCKKCGCVVDDESQDYCFACLVEEEPPVTIKAEDQTQEESIDWVRWLASTLQILAWLELVAGVIGAFVGGLGLENGFIFFGCLIGGIIGFVTFYALSVCVKAANKYLNN